MLHIQVPVCLTYHLHVSMPVAQGSSRARSTAVRLQQKRLLCACVPVRLAKGYTPRLHLNVVAELPGKSPVCFTQVKVTKVTGASPVYFALVKRTGRISSSFVIVQLRDIAPIIDCILIGEPTSSSITRWQYFGGHLLEC